MKFALENFGAIGFLSQSDEAVIFEYFVILSNDDPALLTLNLAYFKIKPRKSKSIRLTSKPNWQVFRHDANARPTQV